jgi:hypothetical protein
MFDLTKVKSHKNGGIFKDPAGIEYRVTPQLDAHARSQFLAANLYNFTGVRVERTDLVNIDPKQLPGKSGIGVKSEIITPSPLADINDPFLNTNKSKEQIAHGFAIDAWLGNLNVAGVSGENLVIDKKNDVHRTNLGGAIFFNENGTLKHLEDSVTEIDALRNPNLNPAAAKIFANVTDDDIRAGVANLEKLKPETIKFIIEQSGFTGAEATALKNKLTARRLDLIARFGSTATTPTPTPTPTSVITPAPSTQPTATNALGGTKTFTALQKAKVQSIFAKHNVKWHNKTNAIYDAALDVSKTHPDLTLGDALDIMDGTLKKTDKPFRTKVEKWLKTSAGKQHAIIWGGSAPLGGTSSTVSPSGVTPTITPSLGKPAVEFDTPLPRVLTPQAADTLQERINKAWPPPWNVSQRQALKTYTGDAYIKINECLRTGGQCSPATLNTISQIRKAVKPSTDDIVVYRKTQISAFGLESGNVHPDDVGLELSALIGKTFTDKGVTSTSITQGTWHGVVDMEIDVPKGTRLAWVKRLSTHAEEDEIILTPGTRFEVISVDSTPTASMPGGYIHKMKLRVIVDEVQ